MRFTSLKDFQVRFMEAYFGVMDPNDLLCTARTWQRADVSRHTGGDLPAALGGIKAKTFVMPINEDIIVPVGDCSAEQAMILGSELRVVESISGHFGLNNLEPLDSKNLEPYMQQIDTHLGELLDLPVPS